MTLPTGQPTGTEGPNGATARKYLNTKGQDRLRRYQLFAEEGVGGLWTTDTGEPIKIVGRDALRRHGEWSLRIFPDWNWFNIEIYETIDPHKVWAECDGEGVIRFERYPEGHYRNHFLHYFEFNDHGQITLQREFMNPVMQFRALGLTVPTIDRGKIPT